MLRFDAKNDKIELLNLISHVSINSIIISKTYSKLKQRNCFEFCATRKTLYVFVSNCNKFFFVDKINNVKWCFAVGGAKPYSRRKY